MEYDKLRAKRMFEFFDEFDSSSNVLDVGCGGSKLTGGGELIFMLKNSNRDLGVYGCDINREAIQNVRNRNLENLIQGDLYKLPFKGYTFDIVFCMDVIEHLFDPHMILSEISRVLKNNGFAYFHIPLELHLEHRLKILFGKNIHNPLAVGSHIRFFKPVEVRELLDGSGFEILKIKYYCPGYQLTNYLPKLEEFISNRASSLFAGNILVKAKKKT